MDTLMVIENDQVVELSAGEVLRRLFLAALDIAKSGRWSAGINYELLGVSNRVIDGHRQYLQRHKPDQGIDWTEIGKWLAPFQKTLDELARILEDHAYKMPSSGAPYAQVAEWDGESIQVIGKIIFLARLRDVDLEEEEQE